MTKSEKFESLVKSFCSQAGLEAPEMSDDAAQLAVDDFPLLLELRGAGNDHAYMHMSAFIGRISEDVDPDMYREILHENLLALQSATCSLGADFASGSVMIGWNVPFHSLDAESLADYVQHYIGEGKKWAEALDDA